MNINKNNKICKSIMAVIAIAALAVPGGPALGQEWTP